MKHISELLNELLKGLKHDTKLRTSMEVSKRTNRKGS